MATWKVTAKFEMEHFSQQIKMADGACSSMEAEADVVREFGMQLIDVISGPFSEDPEEVEVVQVG
jgi:hypothetical protein